MIESCLPQKNFLKRNLRNDLGRYDECIFWGFSNQLTHPVDVRKTRLRPMEINGVCSYKT